MGYKHLTRKHYLMLALLVLLSIAIGMNDLLAKKPQSEKKATISHQLIDKAHWFKIQFPNIPEWKGYVGYWAFESQWEYQSHQQQADGSMLLHYQFRGNDIEITLTPEVGAVDIVAKIISSNGKPLISRKGGYADYNPDVSVQHADLFKQKPQWKDYFELVTREFIFTNDDPKGWIFLDKTKRLMPPNNSTEEGRNLPAPWVQVYRMAYNKKLKWDKYAKCNHGYASCSPSHEASVPLMGIVSHDGKYLFANAGDASVYELQNMWRSCLHVDPQWNPFESDVSKRTIHTKIYVMKNDKKLLLKRYMKDFYPQGDYPYKVNFLLTH